MAKRKTDEEKATAKRLKMIEYSKCFSIQTHKNKVAKVFQQMIRAEDAANPHPFRTAVVNGKLQEVKRSVGQCVCITCGAIHAWKGSNKLDTGHFIGGRRPSLVFDEANVAPQCKYCNQYMNGHGSHYLLWMEHVRGPEVIQILKDKHHQGTNKFTHEDLVDLQIEFTRRLKAAGSILLR